MFSASSASSSASTLRTAGSSAFGSSENPRECSCGGATGRPVPLLTQWLLDRVAAG